MHNQPGNISEVRGVMLEDPSYSAELAVEPHILMFCVFIPFFWME